MQMSDAPLSMLQAIILGLIQALTEFLPVSSSGHLVIGQHLLGVKQSGGALFEVAVHVGTLISILIILRKDVSSLIRGLFARSSRSEEWSQEIRFIVLSMIPAGFIGSLFKNELESSFSHLWSVGLALIFTSILLLSTRKLGGQRTEVGVRDALLIGIAQAIAILPGVSRSGATISTALWLGVERNRAARLSFLMSLPVVGGAGLLKAIDLASSLHDKASTLNALMPVLVGSITSFIFGLFALSAMLKWIARPSFAYFGFYCFGVGLISLYYGI